MTLWTDRDWQVYYLTHPDHEGMSVEDAAKKMGIESQELKYILYSLHAREPNLFVDISGDGRRPAHKTVRYGTWADDKIKQNF